MAEAFLALSRAEQRDALGVAASASGRPLQVLEKDVWVVATLNALFHAPFGDHLVFKGGTSLSKAFGAIRRFSEDVDVTYDIRNLLPELATRESDPLPHTNSQADKWSKLVRKHLPDWITEVALPTLNERFEKSGIRPDLRMVGDAIHIGYESAADEALSYLKPAVAIEFGARATGEPCSPIHIECDAAEYLSGLEFPNATPVTMAAERTFWEKATAVHVACSQNRLNGERQARHWHDLVMLDDSGYAERALRDRALAERVARHKIRFFRVKDASGMMIDYEGAVSKQLILIPQSPLRGSLEEDYAEMVTAGLLEEDAMPFSELMTRCADLQNRANALAKFRGRSAHA